LWVVFAYEMPVLEGSEHSKTNDVKTKGINWTI
jgi:hypothetical protein